MASVVELSILNNSEQLISSTTSYIDWLRLQFQAGSNLIAQKHHDLALVHFQRLKNQARNRNIHVDSIHREFKLIVKHSPADLHHQTLNDIRELFSR